MKIELDDLSSPDIRSLLDEHFRNMHEVSPRDSVHAFDIDRLRGPDITFWSARDGSELLGCGALRELDRSHAEIKSMRTSSTRRRAGIGRAILAHIVEVARSRGYERLSLETGSMDAFIPARTLYESYGFRHCAPFGDYVDDPNSVFMTMRLSDPVGGLAHWENIYRSKDPAQVSWYQSEATISLELIQSVATERDAAIVDVGAGTSRLVDQLLAFGYENLTLLDVSRTALELTRIRLENPATAVSFVAADVLTVSLPESAFGVWHDRAVFHFLTDPADRRRYVGQLTHALRPGGFALIATFAEDGPERCSGLSVVRYSAESLRRELGFDFLLVDSRREEHQTPSGAIQQFTYCLFQRRSPE